MPYEVQLGAPAPSSSICPRCGCENPFVNILCAECGASISRAPMLVATSSFPVLTATTHSLPAATPIVTHQPRAASGWKFAVVVVSVMAGGFLAGRMLMPHRVASPAAFHMGDDLRRPLPQSPRAAILPRPIKRHNENRRERARRAFLRGYHSRPDLTAGSPQPYQTAMHDWKMTHPSAEF